MFSCEFYKFSKNTFFTEQLWTTASVRTEISQFYKREFSDYYKRKIFWKIVIPFPLTRIFCVRTKQMIFRPDGFEKQELNFFNRYVGPTIQ